MFATFYLPNSYGSSSGFLNMSLSPLCAGNNKVSLIKYGAQLDLQNQLEK
jgi:hypothetical protein